MATFPRLLSARTEFRILRALCNLPPGVQRLIAGRPPRIDGQELAPEVNLVLRLGRLVGERSLSSGTAAEGRADNRRTTAAIAGPPIPVAAVEDISLPGPAGQIPARLYRPPRRGAGSQGLLVYFHGGGFVVGDLDTQDLPCRFLCTEADMPVLSVAYRLAPEHPFPAAVEDAGAGYRWAVENASELGAEPDRIAVAGDSAGANLAGGVCFTAREDDIPLPVVQLLLYPVTDAVERRRSRELFGESFYLTSDDMDWFQNQYLPTEDLVHDPRASILRAESFSGLPPAYIATAGFDPLRDEGTAYAECLREAAVPVVLRNHPSLIHGFANMAAVSRTARAAMFEAAGALQMGVAAGALARYP